MQTNLKAAVVPYKDIQKKDAVNDTVNESKAEIENVPFYWWLLPLLLGMVGGIIGYLALRKRDKDTGIMILALGLLLDALILAPLYQVLVTSIKG